MIKPLLLLILLGGSLSLKAQEISIPVLFRLVELTPKSIDTLLKGKGYRILEKEKDSTAELVYYTNVERTEQGATWVRSVSYTEVNEQGVKSRLVLYRTYRKKEYTSVASWLLNNNFRTVSKTNYLNAVHTKYTDGQRNLVIKITRQKLPSGVLVNSYEVEIGL